MANSSIYSPDCREPCYEPWNRQWEQALVKPSDEIFRSLIERLIAKHGDAKTLAKKLGVSGATVSRWKDGEREPKFQHLDRIAKLLKVPVAELWLDETDDRIPFMRPEVALDVLREWVSKIPQEEPIEPGKGG